MFSEFKKSETLLRAIASFSATIVFIITLKTHFNNTYPGYLIVLLLSLTLPLISQKLRASLKEKLNFEIILILIIGLALRSLLSLHNFIHLNYHGPFYIDSIIKMWGFEVIPYGFTYNIFWYPVAKLFGLTHQLLFQCNLLLNLATSFLLYFLANLWFKQKASSLIVATLFALSPLQIAISATESHFNLYSFFIILLLILTEFREEKEINIAIPFVLAFTTFIRPTMFAIFPAFMFYLYCKDRTESKRKLSYNLIYISFIYIILTIIPFIDAFNSFYKVIYLMKTPLSAGKTELFLNIFSQKYYVISYPLLVGLGLFTCLRLSNAWKKLFSLIPIIGLVLFESSFKNAQWHISIYYQTSIEILYFFLIALFYFEATKKFQRHASILTGAILLFSFFQLYSKMHIYNQKFDEQFEHEFVWSNIDTVKNNQIIYQIDERTDKSELFNAYYFSRDHKVNYKTLTRNEFLSTNFPTLDHKNIFYKSLALPEETFEIIKIKNGLIPIRTLSFKFKKRFESHIKDGSIVNVGFYEITK